MLLMAAQGRPDLDSVPETIAFLTGLIGVPVAAAAAALHLTQERPVWIRASSALAAVVAVALVIGLVQPALTALPGDAWIQEEAVFGLLGLVALAAGFILARTDERSRAAP